MIAAKRHSVHGHFQPSRLATSTTNFRVRRTHDRLVHNFRFALIDSQFQARRNTRSARCYLTFLGWSAHTWDVNSLSRCHSKWRSISSKDGPVGAPEGLNRQSHSEQPKPRKRCFSIHTSFRFIVASV